MTGTVFVVGGVNDPRLLAAGWRLGLRWAGLPHAVQDFHWQLGGWAVVCYGDLWKTGHHRVKAAQLAGLLRIAPPPVHVLAHSAGTAITAYALESLTPDEAVLSAAFVGSGLSPGYDLSRAIGGCRYGLLSVESVFDCFTLGVGTSLFGSCDRRWGPAAGMVGFREPKQPAAAAKFHRLKWSPRLLRQGWTGGHTTERSPWLARHTLAGWVREAEEKTERGARG